MHQFQGKKRRTKDIKRACSITAVLVCAHSRRGGLVRYFVATAASPVTTYYHYLFSNLVRGPTPHSLAPRKVHSTSTRALFVVCHCHEMRIFVQVFPLVLLYGHGSFIVNRGVGGEAIFVLLRRQRVPFLISTSFVLQVQIQAQQQNLKIQVYFIAARRLHMVRRVLATYIHDMRVRAPRLFIAFHKIICILFFCRLFIVNIYIYIH